MKSGVRTGRDLRELKETDVCECDCVFVSICCVWTQIVLPFTLVFLSFSPHTHKQIHTHTHARPATCQRDSAMSAMTVVAF